MTLTKIAHGTYKLLGFTFTMTPNAFTPGHTWMVFKPHGGFLGAFPTLGPALAAVKS